MPTVIETTVYKFEELSEDAKQKAIESFSDINVDYDWWDWAYEDAATIGLTITGFDIDRGRSISGDIKGSTLDCVEKILTEHGQECDSYKLAAAYKERETVIRVSYKLLAEDDSSNEDEEIEELETEFKKDLLNYYWKLLDKHYDDITSDEGIKETIIANKYDFEEDGSRF